ncbi:hypothetical protein [Prosthecomicrobium sp. N25]|uniref:hypothetical protein n=1 Tax=Prosthecomicrobium sp. N25 TaxID=3129254 RepID=UPI003077A653
MPLDPEDFSPRTFLRDAVAFSQAASILDGRNPYGPLTNRPLLNCCCVAVELALKGHYFHYRFDPEHMKKRAHRVKRIYDDLKENGRDPPLSPEEIEFIDFVDKINVAQGSRYATLTTRYHASSAAERTRGIVSACLNNLPDAQELRKNLQR